MFNGNTVWPVILLVCSLFNFFYMLHFQWKKTNFEEYSDSISCIMYMLLVAALSVLGTICIIGFWIYCYIKDAPRRNAERREKLCGLIQEFNVMTGKEKYER